MRAFGTQRDPTVGNPPNEDGRVGVAFGRAVRTSCTLGLGGRTAHVSERTPDVANDVVRKLSNEEPQDGCLGELRAAANELDHKGFWWRLSWTELHEASRPSRTETREPGEWPHGWQYWASSVLDTHFRENSMLTNRPGSCQAHLRSHSGRNAGVAFAPRPDHSRVHNSSSPLSGVAVGAPPAPPACDGSHMQRVP